MKYELAGEVLDITKLPPGCPFAPRCKMVSDKCRAQLPMLEGHIDGRLIACHHAISRPAEADQAAFKNLEQAESSQI
jgi:hypothetical protein